ncbi:Hypothetical Protein RradSPS_0605 [Rubrobacter radiotolerans]|uniref:Uncharacterized protein n=1 Tax=Rubrobacter radiotolerans TaxID=42256 RepID=A0A023X0L3_RUBRA|nr:hypothetical protein [Rubrobacter radiotolerans]AHY45888.1 Hypothetical Protein RradSPS_0605 [Rubrobacter radiotolerans]MDX5893301.1 hypothetical protein [Rubrobacter radiotolerans]SMC03463.1 hypothetical protein SAMN00767673_0605 [Rubrobacter radiotolerans DSM 5868]
MDAATIAQIVSAAGTLAYLVVFGTLYYMLVRLYRGVLEETREERTAKDRPQVIVEDDYSRLPDVDLVIRNISQGAAKDITFEFSSKIESSDGFIISDLTYFKNGLNFLGPESEIRLYWDTLDNLVQRLKENGFTEGITVTVRCRDLSGKVYTDRWTFNPLVYEGNRTVRNDSFHDLVRAVEKISDRLDAMERRAEESRRE